MHFRQDASRPLSNDERVLYAKDTVHVKATLQRQIRCIADIFAEL